jgi:hypothetical protein
MKVKTADIKEYQRLYHKKTYVPRTYNREKKYKDSKDYYEKNKEKCKTKQQTYYRKKENLIKAKYVQQIRSSERNITPPNYTYEELLEWSNNNNFDYYYNLWVENDYDRNYSPSFDRIDDYCDYKLDNLRIVSWKDNADKGHLYRRIGKNNKASKAVIKMDLDGNYLDEYFSISEAARRNNLKVCSISLVCNGKQIKTGGYKFSFKNKLFLKINI